MKTLKCIYLLVLISLLCACGGGSGTKNTENTVDSNEKVVTENTQQKLFPIERGIIHQKATAMGIDINPVIYFDKWGLWQASYTTMDMGIVNITTIQLTKDRDQWSITLNKDEKKGTHSQLGYSPANAAGVDLNELTKEIMERHHIESLGEEKFLGYTCKKYRMKRSDGTVRMDLLAYGNILMKVTGGMMDFEVTKIEDTTPPADKFEIPEGVVITEQ